MHLVGGHLSIGCSRRVMRGRRARVILPVFLLILMSLSPIVSADATITLSSNTLAQEADSDNPAEYTLSLIHI